MMNESLIRLATALAGKWKEEHLVPIMPKAKAEVCHHASQHSVLGSQNMCLHSLACCAYEKKKKSEGVGEGR